MPHSVGVDAVTHLDSILASIASQFRGFPEEDLSVAEDKIVDILVDAGYLKRVQMTSSGRHGDEVAWNEIEVVE